MTNKKVRKNLKFFNFYCSNLIHFIAFLFFICVVFLFFTKTKYEFGFTKAEFIRNGQTIKQFNLKVANTPKLRARGLMFVKKLKENDGMIFIYPNDEELVFWMKNTYLPLDLVFLNKDYKIIGVVENMLPLDETKRYQISGKSRYAVELPAFSVKKYALRIGDELRILK